MISKLYIAAIIGICGGLAVPLFVIVHQLLDRLCVRHARIYCEKNGLTVRRVRWSPAFSKQGIKTEFTIVQLDCLDSNQTRKLIEVLVWPLAFRKLLRNENYPASLDDTWPKKMGENPPGR